MTVPPLVRRSLVGDVVVLSPVGEFDLSNTDMLRAACLEAVGEDATRVVVDLAGTTFVDSMAIGVMLGVARTVNERGGWVRVAAPRPNVRGVLKLTGLDKVFGLFDSVDEAIAPVEPGAGSVGTPEFA